IEIEEGHAGFIDPHTVIVNGKHLTGEKILIATGSRPISPPIKGLAEVPFLTSGLMTSSEPVELTECPESMLIVGGGYIALELGQMFFRFGAKVTILERGEELLSYGYEPEVGPTIRAVFREEGIDV